MKKDTDAYVPRRRAVLLALSTGLGLAAARRGEAATPQRGRPGRNAVLGGGGIHHTTVRTNDWERSLQFYEQVLGFRVLAAWEERDGSMDERLAGIGAHSQRWAYLDSGDGSCIEIFEDRSFTPPAPDATDPTKSPGGPLVHFGLRTTRIDEVCKRAHALGVRVLEDPVDYTLHTTTGQGAIVMRLFFVQGPNGEWIELVQNAP